MKSFMKSLVAGAILATSVLADSSSSAHVVVTGPDGITRIGAQAVKDTPKKAVYYTAWGQKADELDRVKGVLANGTVDTLYVSFLRWDGLGNIRDDDGAVYDSISDNWESHTHKALREIQAEYGDKVRIIATFGGYTYAGMWDAILDPTIRKNLAQNIVNLMGGYVGSYWDGAREFNGLIIDGIDFDFERSVRITPALNDAFVELIKEIREIQYSGELKSYPDGNLNNTPISHSYVTNGSNPKVRADQIMVTTYHVGADPVECGTNVELGPIDGCSYVNNTRSSHHGEIARMLSELAKFNLVDGYNLMLYDAGKINKDFFPDVAVDNYAKYIPLNRVNAGITIKSQWGADGNFIETTENIVGLMKYYKNKALNGYFMWSIGGTSQTGNDAELTKILYGAWNNWSTAKMWDRDIDINFPAYVPNHNTWTVPTEVSVFNGTVSKLGRDHSAIAENGKYYVQLGGTRYEAGETSPELHNGAPISITDNSDIRALENNAEALRNYFNASKSVELRTRNGHWTRNINLPDNIQEGSVFIFKRSAGWDTNIRFNGFVVTPPHGSTTIFKYTNGKYVKLGGTKYEAGEVTPGVPISITHNSDIRALENNAEALRNYFNASTSVELRTQNGHWTRNINLPDNIQEGSVFIFKRSAGWHTNIRFNGLVVSPPHGSTTIFKYTNGTWFKF